MVTLKVDNIIVICLLRKYKLIQLVNDMADITTNRFKKHGKYLFIKEKQGFAEYSFLRYVLVGFKFEVSKDEMPDDYEKRFKQYFEYHFQVTPNVEQFWENGIDVHQIGNAISYRFISHGIFIEVDAKKYHNFLDDVMPAVQRAKIFIDEVLQHKESLQFTIRKINHFNFDPKQPVSDERIASLIYSETLRKLQTNQANKEDNERQYPKLHKYRFPDSNENNVILRTLIINNARMRRAILDIETTKEDISIDKIYEVVRAINHTQYLSFLWAVTTQVLEWMYQQRNEQ